MNPPAAERNSFRPLATVVPNSSLTQWLDWCIHSRRENPSVICKQLDNDAMAHLLELNPPFFFLRKEIMNMSRVCKYFRRVYLTPKRNLATNEPLVYRGSSSSLSNYLRYSTSSFRYYSTSSLLSNTGSSNSQTQFSNRQKQRLESRFYEVCELDYSGTIRCTSLHISDILKGSTMHARDFFSLQLTTYDQKTTAKKQQRVPFHDSFSTSEVVRLQRRPSPAILPRGKKILVCFGHIRAVIGKDHGIIFETHDPLVQVS